MISPDFPVIALQCCPLVPINLTADCASSDAKGYANRKGKIPGVSGERIPWSGASRELDLSMVMGVAGRRSG
jgi:hypothetical protein